MVLFDQATYDKLFLNMNSLVLLKLLLRNKLLLFMLMYRKASRAAKSRADVPKVASASVKLIY
ncbi:hypothetical protein A2U01_0017428, partial [Trifolium medium]|nr:hypothetical protein [Trifolium medium]